MFYSCTLFEQSIHHLKHLRRGRRRSSALVAHSELLPSQLGTQDAHTHRHIAHHANALCHFHISASINPNTGTVFVETRSETQSVHVSQAKHSVHLWSIFTPHPPPHPSISASFYLPLPSVRYPISAGWLCSVQPRRWHWWRRLCSSLAQQ